MRYLVPILFIASLALSGLTHSGCGKKVVKADTTNKDTAYVSEHFLNDDNNTENTENNNNTSFDEPKPKRERSSDWSGGGGGGGIRNSGKVWSSKYQNYQRSGNRPADFAEAMVWHVIRLVYDEEFTSARSRVLSSKTENGLLVIEMEVTWSDEWVKNYTVKGLLTLKDDGTDVHFEITSKNKAAEALEFTHENTKNQIALGEI